MATISSTLSPNLLQHHPTRGFVTQQPQPSKPHLRTLKSHLYPHLSTQFSVLHRRSNAKQLRRAASVAGETAAAEAEALDPSSEAARTLYVGNIPRKLGVDELCKTFEEHGAVEKAEVLRDKYSGRSRRFAFVTMKTVEDADAAVEQLNGTQIEGREIKVNVTEKPLSKLDLPIPESEESQFIDSPHKVYVGNIAKTVTTEMLKNFFAEKGKVLGAKVSRVPGTSKSIGFGFVSFSSEDDVEATISSLNKAWLEGRKIRVHKA